MKYVGPWFLVGPDVAKIRSRANFQLQRLSKSGIFAFVKLRAQLSVQ